MNLIILGPPGSGKGTQSQFLKEQYNLKHLSTGDLFRDEITKQSPIGKKAQAYVDKGQYVPDEIINEIINNTLSNIKHNFILDGYPRTIPQVAWLDKILTNLDETLSMVLYLDINEETVIKRLSSRITCPQCKAIYNLHFLPPKVSGICDNDGIKLIKRTDDSDEKTIITRLKTYKLATAPLVASYQARGLLRTVDANQDNSSIKNQIKSYLLPLKGKKIMISIKTQTEIQNIKAASQVVALIHKELASLIKVGVTGKILDKAAAQIIKENNALPSFLNYHGFPATICVSVNEQLIHGIPNNKPFKMNDIVKIDAGASVNGYHADAAFTMCVGNNPTLEQAKLINVTKESLNKAVAIIAPGVRLGDISNTIQTYVESQGFYLPTSYTGHGIGKALHEDPAIPNVGKPNTGIKLQAGMTICIEPMVQTTTDQILVLDDKWTVVAADRQQTAHFEHTILVTNDGCEVLTILNKNQKNNEGL